MKRRREDEQKPAAGQPPLKQPRANGWQEALSNFLSLFSQPAEPQPRYLEPPTDESPISELPPEMLTQILSLVPLNLRLREVNRAFVESIDDVLWHQMKAKQGEEFGAQWQRQQDEIDYLQQSKSAVLKIVENNPSVRRAYEKLEGITGETPIALYAREKTLNFINEAIVRQKIDPQSNELNCANCYLTRLPETLMTDPALADFWKKLKTLYLSQNRLSSLPESFGKLTALEELSLVNIRLSSLPESLGQLTALKQLFLGRNQLSSLPESFGQLTALQTLFLEHNQFNSLPESLGQLTALAWLNLTHNQLSSLPESLGQLTALAWLALNHNRLRVLPDTLAENILVNELGGHITKMQALEAQTKLPASPEKKPTALGKP